MTDEFKDGVSAEVTATKRRSFTPFAIAIIIVVAAVVLWKLPHTPTAQAPAAPSTPRISDVQTGTYATTTKSIVVEKDTFNQTEDIGFHGVVHNLPGGSSLMVILSSGNKNYYFNQLNNPGPVEEGPFHFVFGQKRPAGTYTLLLELFGPDKQMMGEKIVKEITVK